VCLIKKTLFIKFYKHSGMVNTTFKDTQLWRDSCTNEFWCWRLAIQRDLGWISKLHAFSWFHYYKNSFSTQFLHAYQPLWELASSLQYFINHGSSFTAILQSHKLNLCIIPFKLYTHSAFIHIFHSSIIIHLM
jgi:hypothetical protein